ncbi:MAG: hypothetical protein J0M21_00080 [Xanthomonadales bacterium]|nr:hypothetical protein [Xanthomonadales bacterium]
MAITAGDQPRDVGDLVRLVEGMMADGVFVQAEADYLFQWMREHKNRLNQYPYSAIYRRLHVALADGVLDEDEAADIGEFFKRLVVEPGIVEAAALHAGTNAPRTQSATQVVERPAISEHPAPGRGVKKRASGRAVVDLIMITYLDSMGFESVREVTVHSCDGEYMKGYCHLRGSARTFRVDRIVGDIVRVETGEVLPVAIWQDSLGI